MSTAYLVESDKDMKKVTIIDYQLGNLFSVKQACEVIGVAAKVSDKPKDIIESDALILPGVGAFKEAVDQLKSLGLFEVIIDEVKKGKPLMGICLGLQLLFTKSEEFGETEGLNLIPGVINKFDSQSGMKVPHVGWNHVMKANQTWENTPLESLDFEDYMYFVHSYYVVPEDEECILTNTQYLGTEFCSSIKKSNIFATQFHPEKSAEKGLSIYRNWALQNNLI